MTQWREAAAYIELAYAIQKYIPNYVDAYFGPPEIKEFAENQERQDLKELSRQADAMIKSTRRDSALPAARKEYLLAQLTGMQTTLEILQGKSFKIIEETRLLYGLTPAWVDEGVFKQIHRKLEDLLPGKGTLYERAESFREKTVIPENKIEPLARNISAELRKLTRNFIPLPETENCEYKLVKNQPWLAYNWYLGSYQSKIEINTDLPIYITSFPWFIAHEAYPGHHTDNVIKEKFLYREKGFLEECVHIYNTPVNTLAEGIGENALEIAAAPRDIISFFQFILDEVGMKEFDGKLIYDITNVWKDLSLININLVLMIHGRGASDQEVIDYQIQYGLESSESAIKSLEFLKDPLYRSYACLYPMGRQLVYNYISRGGDRKARFLKLLQEQATPAQLMRMGSA